MKNLEDIAIGFMTGFAVGALFVYFMQKPLIDKLFEMASQ
jgi:hypothetical protein